MHVNGVKASVPERQPDSGKAAPPGAAAASAPEPPRTAGAPPPGSPAAVVASLAAQVNEVVAGQRTMSRRFDTFERAFERAVNQAVVGAMADLERRLVQRIVEVVDNALATRLSGIEEKVDAQTSNVTKVVTSLGGSSAALSSLEKKLGERVEKLGASTDTHAGETMARLASYETATKAALANVERRVAEVLDSKLGVVTTTQRAAAAAHGEHLEAIEKNVDAMSSTLKSMMDDTAASQQKKSWWR